jgi:hypothetical protein
MSPSDLEFFLELLIRESDTFILLQEPQPYIGLVRMEKRLWPYTLFKRVLMLNAPTMLNEGLYIWL